MLLLCFPKYWSGDFRLFFFYNTYFEAVVQHDGALMAGGSVNLSVEEIKKIYDEISILDLKINEIEKEISEEDNFNARMELNIEAHGFKEQKEKMINKLKGEWVGGN